MKNPITTQTSKKFHPEFKWVQQIKFYIFGFQFWTEIHAIEALPQVTETAHLADLEEMAMYIEWRNKCHLPYIENTQFDLTLNTKF